MRKDSQFRWGVVHQKAFETLKTSLVSYPILAYPDFDKPFVLSTDASDEAIASERFYVNRMKMAIDQWHMKVES